MSIADTTTTTSTFKGYLRVSMTDNFLPELKVTINRIDEDNDTFTRVVDETFHNMENLVDVLWGTHRLDLDGEPVNGGAFEPIFMGAVDIFVFTCTPREKK